MRRQHRPTTNIAVLTGMLLLPIAHGADAENMRMRTSAGTRAEVNAVHGRMTDRLIVKYRDGMPAEQRSLDRIAQRQGIGLRALRAESGGTRVLGMTRAVSLEKAAAMAADLVASDRSVEYAEPDRLLGVEMTPSDPMYASQWDLKDVNVEAGALNTPVAWDQSRGNGVIVSVVDTGYRPHQDLVSNLVAGYDFITDSAIANDGNGRDADASDPGDFVTSAESSQGVFAGCGAYNSSWHGTHVAGTIAGVANNGAGIAGVASGARVQPARVLGKCGGYTSDIAAAIIWAAGGTVNGAPANPTPAKVINLSLGGPGSCGTTLQNAINTARARGAVVVVAAGNSNTNAAGFSPANCGGVITVASVGRTGARAYYSNYGSNVDVAAPGGDMSSGSANGILSTLNSGTTTPGADAYAYYQGTSMAAPHVAGVVALMRARNGSLTPDEVEARLRSSARSFPGACSACGSGIVDASAAVTAAAVASTVVAERETNDTLAKAQAIGAYSRYSGSIGKTTDLDWLRITVDPGRKLTAVMTPSSGANFDLTALDARGTTLTTSANGSDLTEVVTVRNNGTSRADFYLRITRVSGTGNYTLSTSQ